MLWQASFSDGYDFDGVSANWDIKEVNIYVVNVLNTILAVIHCTTNIARGRRDLDRRLVGFYNYLCNQYLVPLML